ncbi:putative RNA-directed DNA polymerase [Helianthus debilis subsp. tardiflorus]
MEDRDLEEEELWTWEECKKDVIKIEQWKCRDLHQKSRVRWASKGDDNSAYFHRVVNGRKAANDIPGIEVEGQWITKPSIVKREVLRFFRNHFSEKYSRRPEFHCDWFKMVPVEDARRLVRGFTKEEIREAVLDCGSDRAPGPDGFNFNFIKQFWNVLEDDSVKMFNSFFETGVISRGCSTSFITLVPKTVSPMGLKDYRPITLVGVISKIISKVLASRVKEVMGKIISESQTAFLKDRFILEGPLILNELYGWIKKTGRQAFLLKIDFEKAYDNVNWGFLLSILSQMGFPNRWCLWIQGILNSSRSAVLVNGSPTFEFQCQKGVRQGDPLSPFLFLIIMEAFSCLVRKACELGELKDLRFLSGNLPISHLLYADDAVILGEWSRDNIEKTARLLRVFHSCSGLKINIKKSFLFGIGVGNEEVTEMANLLGCRHGEFPFDYLGVKQCVVADRLVWDGRMWKFIPNWKHILSTVEELSEMQDVEFLLNNSSLSREVDRWVWGEDANEPMSVSSVKKWVRNGSEVRRDHSMRWESWVPNKVKVFVWRAEMGRIPTKEALVRRHVSIQDGSCPFCNSADENVLHLFTGCYFACGIWEAVGSWCDIGHIVAFDFNDLLILQDRSQKGKWVQKIIRGIVYIACWVVWKLRNEKVFQGANPKVVDAVALVKSWSFLWLKSRSKFSCIRWKDWGRNPLYML